MDQKDPIDNPQVRVPDLLHSDVGLPVADTSFSEAAFQKLVGLVSDAVIWLDPDLRIGSWNPAAERIYGWRQTEVLGKELFEVFKPDLEETDWINLFQTLSNGGTVTRSIQERDRKGDPVISKLSISGVLNETGLLSGYILTAQNLTPFMKAREQILISEQRYRSLVEHAPEAILVMDLKSRRFLEINQQAVDLLGYSREELLRLGPVSVSPEFQPDGRNSQEIATEILSKAVKKEVYTLLWYFLHKEGRLIPCEITLVLLPDKKNKLIRGTVVEISERKKIQDALRKSKEYFQTIIEHGFECVSIVDSEGKINFISQPVERILGYQPDELRGMSVFSHIHPEEIRESTEKMVDLLQKPGETNRSVTRIQSKKGEWLYIETVSTNLLHDEAIAGIVVNFRDISQSIQTARELKESKLLLEKKVAARTVQLQRSVTDLENFAYLVSHDLQEPLRTIVSYLQLLELRFGGKMDPGGLEFLEYAVNGAKRMKNLLNGILEYSRIRKNEPRREQTDLNQVVKEVINDLSSLTKEKQAFISREPLPVIMADKAQMIRLFQNLIGNALKFSGEKNPPVIRVYGGKIGNQPVISIEDNGIGIEPSSGNKIFGMFQRLHTEETYSGLGIGLSICQEIVQRHNGRIWFESRPGKGTTFHFTLDP